MPSSIRYGAWLWLGTLVLTALVGCGGSNKKKPDTSVLQQGAQSHYNRGHRYLQTGRPDLAAREFEACVAAEPANALYWNVLGLAHIGTRSFEAAIANFEETLEINPYFTDAYNNLGVVYSEMGELDQALRMFLKVLEDRTYPTPEVARFNLGRIFAAQGDPESALPYLRKAVLRRPENVEWRLELALVLLQVEEHAEARNELTAAYELDPLNISVLYRLGYAHYMLKEYPEARKYFRRVVTMTPDSRMAQLAQDYLDKIGRR